MKSLYFKNENIDEYLEDVSFNEKSGRTEIIFNTIFKEEIRLVYTVEKDKHLLDDRKFLCRNKVLNDAYDVLRDKLSEKHIKIEDVPEEMEEGEKIYIEFLNTTEHLREYKLAKLKGLNVKLSDYNLPNITDLSESDSNKLLKWMVTLPNEKCDTLHLWAIDNFFDFDAGQILFFSPLLNDSRIRIYEKVKS